MNEPGPSRKGTMPEQNPKALLRIERHGEPQQGGDAACWLSRVCPTCGAFNEDPNRACWHCGTVADDTATPTAP